jgi:hypothetical protein
LNKENLQGLDWQRWVKWLLALKFAFAVIVTFGEFSHPHIIRQLDTMGVALRYWSRWTLEGATTWPLLPAVLTAGDTSGITPMEFPIMNLIYAPIECARVAAWLTHVLFASALTFWHYRLWRGKNVASVGAEKAAMLLPLVGISSVFFGRFMPDYVAFILVSSAICFSWDKPRPLGSFALAALGLLIKPPAIVALALLLLLPIRRYPKCALWVLPAVICTLVYYKLGNGFIKSVSDYPVYFLTELRNPLQSLIEFVQHPKDVAKLFLKNLIAPQFFILFLVAVGIWKKLERRQLWLLAVLLVQVILGAALDGEHSFIHFYYFMGTAFVSALLVTAVIERANQRWVSIFAALALLSFQIEMFSYEVKPLVKNMQGLGLYAQCKQLKKSSADFPWGKGYSFRSSFAEYPDLGLCFGEIQNSKKAEFGFFKKADELPAGCTEKAASADLRLATCSTL